MTTQRPNKNIAVQPPQTAEEWAEWKRKEKIKRRLNDLHIPRRYQGANLSNLLVGENAEKCAREFLAGLDSPSPMGIFLTGIPGSGKTHLAWATIIEAVRMGYTAWFIGVLKLLAKIRATYGGTKTTTEDEILAVCQAVDCLVMDDLGLEKQTEFTLDRLTLIVDERYTSMKPVIITSNLSLPEIAVRMGDKIASRIYQMCTIVELPSIDWRVRLRRKREDADASC